MLSPQKAPERLMQLADSNLESLVIEMDQLHSRVHTIHFLNLCHFLPSFVISSCCHPLSPQHNIMEKEETFRMRSDYVLKKDCKCSSLSSCFHWDVTGKGYTNYSFNNNNKTVSKWATQKPRWTVWIHTQKSIVPIIVGTLVPLLFSSSHPSFVPTLRCLRYRREL